MAQSPQAFCFLAAAFLISTVVVSQPPLDTAEQEAVYKALESINSGIPWRSLFQDDLCASAPHGIVCEYFSDEAAAASDPGTPHITELSFGYVSDYSPNPPCGPDPTLDLSLLSPLSHLRKLYFYKCFTQGKTQFPDFSPMSSPNTSSSIEELVFIDNPALFGSLNGRIGTMKNLRRFILTGSSVSGGLSGEFGEMVNLQQLTLSRNNFTDEIPATVFQNLKNMKLLDLSENGFQGKVPESIGNLTELLKIDLSNNQFSGRIPDAIRNLKSLEFLDLSYNRFGNFGMPLFLGEMSGLKEVYLSGNFLGGQIPEIWGNLGGIRGIGLSGMGLVGKIPKSLGVNLRNVCFLGLDNNRLEGVVPEEFGDLDFLREMNLENNNLSGRVPFSAGFVSRLGAKLKMKGNLDLCIDEALRSAKISRSLWQLKSCRQPDIPQTALFLENSCIGLHASAALIFITSFFIFSVLAGLIPPLHQ